MGNFEPIKYPELFIGLVAPVGADLTEVLRIITKQFTRYSYQTIPIKLSALLEDMPSISEKLKSHPYDERVSSYMTAGNEFRKVLKREDALAFAAMGKVRDERKRLSGVSELTSVEKTVYVFDSLKRKAEVEALRNVYGRSFHLISVYAPKAMRRDNLSKKIANSRGESVWDKFIPRAEELISRDYEEKAEPYGQNVSDAFPLADLFIDETEKKKIEKNIRRYIELMFGHPFHTPTKDEMGLFFAKAAALRSADLSRQVGAAITTEDGNVLSTGCNEVPKAGGGFYWEGDENDNRDYVLGYDTSAVMKNKMLVEILTRLATHESVEPVKESILELCSNILEGKETLADFKDTLLSSILEFGRIVHAEMAAITDAARRGISLEGQTLYCTTFPCHICARHIIASGLKRVVFIEPYPKSKTEELYSDSCLIDKQGESSSKVEFVPFMGVAPTSFIHLFTMPEKRKTRSGDSIKWEAATATSRLKRFIESYILLEDEAFSVLADGMKSAGLIEGD